jgi:hypothetical protein
MGDTLQGGPRSAPVRGRYAPVARVGTPAPWVHDTPPSTDEWTFPDGMPWSPAEPPRSGTPVAVPVLVLTDAAPVATPTAGRRRAATVGVRVTAALLLVTALALAALASREHRVAGQWRQLGTRATAQLVAAQAADRTLAARVSSLQAQVDTLDGRLATAASAKEQAVDRTTVLGQLVDQERGVSTQFQTCVADLQRFISLVGTDLDTGNYGDPHLSQESTTASADCSRAQRADQGLRTALGGAAG